MSNAKKQKFEPRKHANQITESVKTDWVWIPPVPYPSDGLLYIWDEEKLNWIEF